MKRALVIAIVALAGAVSVGCGGDDDSEVDPATIADAARATAARGPMRVTFRGTIERADGELVEFAGAGHDHPAARRTQFTTDVAQGVGPLEEGDLDSRIVKVGPVYYMSSRLIRELGVEWLELDVRDFATVGKDVAELLAHSNQSSPAQVFDFARVARTQVAVLSERVAGVTTTNYAGEVPLDAVAEAVPAAERASVADNARRLREATGGDTIPIEAWVDANGLMRRIRMTYEFERGLSSGKPFEATLVLDNDLSEHGRPVRIARPRGRVLGTHELDELAELE